MAQVTMRQMLEAGVHFGHQTRYWNPKMEEYIFSDTATFEIQKYNDRTLNDLDQYNVYARHHSRPINNGIAFGYNDYRYNLNLKELYGTSLLNNIINRLNDLKESTKATWD